MEAPDKMCAIERERERVAKMVTRVDLHLKPHEAGELVNVSVQRFLARRSFIESVASHELDRPAHDPFFCIPRTGWISAEARVE